MKDPILTFRATVRSKATPAAIYDVLADVNTHLDWAGKQSKFKGFRLAKLDAPQGRATIGTQFSSTGLNNAKGTSFFSDRSTVVEAEPGKRFGFDTESRLTRPRAPEWQVRFAHRYTIEPDGAGSIIKYTCEVRPQNYIPPWLKPWARPMTRRMVPMFIRKHMKNMAAMAESPARAKAAEAS